MDDISEEGIITIYRTGRKKSFMEIICKIVQVPVENCSIFLSKISTDNKCCYWLSFSNVPMNLNNGFLTQKIITEMSKYIKMEIDPRFRPNIAGTFDKIIYYVSDMSKAEYNCI